MCQKIWVNSQSKNAKSPFPVDVQLTSIHFFALDGKFPGVGTLELSNPPSWGRKKRANDILFQLTSSFVIVLFLLRLHAVTTPVYGFSIVIKLFSLKLIARCKVNCY